MATKKNEIGRPTYYTRELVQKLVGFLLDGCTIKQACIFSGIPRSVFYFWLETKPEFVDIIEAAQEAINADARRVLIAQIRKGDGHLALSYLKTRDPEFKDKVDVTVKTEGDETRDEIKSFIDRLKEVNASGNNHGAATTADAAATE